MSIATKNPTAFQSPDPGQGGDAVSTPSNTGHASTTSTGTGSGVNSEQKTCAWSGFQNVGGQIKSVTLKFEHTSSGTLNGANAVNNFTVEYHLSGGGVMGWVTAVQRLSFTAAQGPVTFSVPLDITQDLTQVRVRDSILATATLPGQSATCTATVSNVRIEVELFDSQVIVMM